MSFNRKVTWRYRQSHREQRATKWTFPRNKLNKVEGKAESTLARLVEKFGAGATIVFIQVSKYYLTCKTSTESTNRLRQTKNPAAVHRKWLRSFFILLIWKPLTIIILPLCLVTVPRPGVLTASSDLSLSLSLPPPRPYPLRSYNRILWWCRHGPPIPSDNIHIIQWRHSAQHALPYTRQHF
jgi:hypothetical protein